MQLRLLQSGQRVSPGQQPAKIHAGLAERASNLLYYAPDLFKRPFTTMKLAIVIPCYRDAAALAALLADLRVIEIPFTMEVTSVVVDGGECSETAEVATRFGALYLQARRGRGYQLATGCRAVEADCSWLLHADTRVCDENFQA